MKISTLFLAGALALASLITGETDASAAGLLTNGLPPAGGTQYPTTLPFTGNETLPLDTNLLQGLNPASESATVNQLRASVTAQPGTNGYRNALIGGDFTQNLWTRGSSVGSITTPYLYTANNWFDWNGTSSTASVAQDSTAAEKPATVLYAAKIARTGTGVVQNCFGQEVESTSSYRFAGNTAELDFNVYAGAGFSAAGGALQVYILYGTGTDDGAQKMAWGLNSGGGGSTAWSGMANALNSAAIGGVNPTTTTVTLPLSTLSRYAAVANIPATATELGVAICWKPVGASPSNDYIALSNIQLVVNNNLASYAGTITSTVAGISASSFEHRPIGIEALLQNRYLQSVVEPAASISVAPSGQGASTTTCVLSIPLPVTMRAAPTFSAIGTALGATTWTVTHVVTNTVLSTPFIAATTGGSTPTELNVTATVASGLTAGQTCTLTGAAGGSTLLASAEL